MMRLAGRVVATTRDGSSDDPLVLGLRTEGARVLMWPTLGFASTGEAAVIAPRIATYDWVVFTSARAVTELANVEMVFGDIRVAAVGNATASVFADVGGPATVVGTGGAERLVEAMRSQFDLKGARVLFPASERADDVLARELTTAGAHVDRVNVYRTIPRPPDVTVVLSDLARGVDAVTFASPSAVSVFAEALGSAWPSALGTIPAVAIGSTTATAMRRSGVEWVETAPDPSVEGLIEACVLLTRNRNVTT